MPFSTLLTLAVCFSSLAFCYLPSSPHRRSAWKDLPSIPITPRQEHSTVFLPPDTLAIIGGIYPNGTQFPPPTTPIMQFYSISRARWTTRAPLPGALNHINAAVVGGKIYVLGGLAVAEAPYAWRATSDSWIYDPEQDAWETIPGPTAAAMRGSAAVGVYRGKIFLAGGMRDLETLPDGLQSSDSSVLAFDTKTRKWLELPAAARNMPAARDHASCAVVGHKMYVVGGRDHGQVNVRGTVFVLDLENLEAGWTTSSASMPTPRGGLAAGLIGTKIYTFGGEGNTAVESGVFNNTEVYDTATDSWEILPPMKLPRHGTQAFGIRGVVYLPGGALLQGAGPLADFDAFVP